MIGSFSIILEQSMPEAGHMGIVSQSGNIGSYVVQNVASKGLGVSHFIATGNEADIDVADGIAALAEDAQTRLILCCMETCRDAGRLTRALDLARQKNKPVVVLKIGSTDQGQAAAASHTGALASSDAVIDAVFRRYGACGLTRSKRCWNWATPHPFCCPAAYQKAIGSPCWQPPVVLAS